MLRNNKALLERLSMQQGPDKDAGALGAAAAAAAAAAAVASSGGGSTCAAGLGGSEDVSAAVNFFMNRNDSFDM